MHYELLSDRDVFIDVVGLLKAGEVTIVTEENIKLFELLQNTTIANAKFPHFITATLVLDNKE